MDTIYAVPSHAGVERRKHRRYIVRGRVRFLVDSLEVWGDLINFGSGGMQIRSPFDMVPKARLGMRVMAFCYTDSFEVEGQIVGGKDGVVSIQFVNPPAAVGDLLLWLEREHFPWTGGRSESPFAGGSERALGGVSEAEDIVYQQA